MQSFSSVFRRYLLFFAIGTGALVFLAFHYLSFMAPLKPAAFWVRQSGTPIIIFFILFFAFCRIDFKQMRPRFWHFELVAFQALVAAAPALWLSHHPDSAYSIEIQGFIACIITPTAAAAAVITGKLGGNDSSVTTYIVMSNITAAIVIPLTFPLISDKIGGSFISEFMLIMSKVFPMIVLPLLCAIFAKFFMKKLHAYVAARKDWSLYMWAGALTVISSQAIANLVNSKESSATLWLLALVSLFCCAMQFSLGKLFGQLEGQRISAGQGLGQKNMVFGLWVSLAFLSPTASIAPGCYILWQNVVNAAQLAYKPRRDARYKALGKPLYQE